MALTKKPANPIPRSSIPAESRRYKVTDSDDWASIANSNGINVHELIEFNFHTRDPREINWYLREYVGCTKKSPDGKNYCFSASANPGVIYLPAKQPAPKPNPSTGKTKKSYPHRLPGTRGTGWQLKSKTANTHLVPFRIYVDAFIPWEWVKIPDDTAMLSPPGKAVTSAFDFYVHGDGRLEKFDYTSIGNKFRIRGAVEVNLLESENELFRYTVDNQSSKSRLDLHFGTTTTVKEFRGIGPLDHRVKVFRTAANAVNIKMKVWGSVPLHVAGPQGAIDIEFEATAKCDVESSFVVFSVIHKHDGFPAHEIFVDSNSKIRGRSSYHPDWFSPITTGTAHPTDKQSIHGALALSGIYKPQNKKIVGSFTF